MKRLNLFLVVACLFVFTAVDMTFMADTGNSVIFAKTKSSSSSGFNSTSQRSIPKAPKSSSSSGGFKSTKQNSPPVKQTNSGFGSTSQSTKKTDTSKPNTNNPDNKTGFGSTSQNNTQKNTSLLQKQQEQAKKSGKSFSSKTEAIKDFKTTQKSKYPSTFKTKPVTRPDYIPQTTTISGRQVDVIWDPGIGGYGYRNAVGQMILYDAMSDVIMLNALMSRNDYYYDGMTLGSGYGNTPIVRHSWESFISTILLLTAVFCVIFALSFCVLYSNNNS